MRFGCKCCSAGCGIANTKPQARGQRKIGAVGGQVGHIARERHGIAVRAEDGAGAVALDVDFAVGGHAEQGRRARPPGCGGKGSRGWRTERLRRRFAELSGRLAVRSVAVLPKTSDWLSGLKTRSVVSLGVMLPEALPLVDTLTSDVV